MIKISIIIPVYNGEKYIRNCINSVLDQTLKEIEIIVINDGSIDSTKTILAEFENKIRYIEQENQGQGKARNVGIEVAKGEFITFIDADDTIEKNMLKKMYDSAKKENSDIVICDYYEIIRQ